MTITADTDVHWCYFLKDVNTRGLKVAFDPQAGRHRWGHRPGARLHQVAHTGFVVDTSAHIQQEQKVSAARGGQTLSVFLVDKPSRRSASQFLIVWVKPQVGRFIPQQ